MNSTPHLPTRKEIIEQNLIDQIEKEIDIEAHKWIKTKQPKFKYYEKEKIIQYNRELIAFLNTFIDTTKPPTTFREKAVHEIIAQKIMYIMMTVEEYDIDPLTILK